MITRNVIVSVFSGLGGHTRNVIREKWQEMSLSWQEKTFCTVKIVWRLSWLGFLGRKYQKCHQRKDFLVYQSDKKCHYLPKKRQSVLQKTFWKRLSPSDNDKVGPGNYMQTSLARFLGYCWLGIFTRILQNTTLNCKYISEN